MCVMYIFWGKGTIIVIEARYFVEECQMEKNNGCFYQWCWGWVFQQGFYECQKQTDLC